MRQREPERALQADAFRPKGSPCPFGTWLYFYSNTRVPKSAIVVISLTLFL